MLRVNLGDGHDLGLKAHQLLLGNVKEGGVGAHPGGPRRGVNGKDALPGVEEVGRIPRQLEGVEGPGFRVLGDGQQQLPGGVIEDFNFPGIGGVPRPLLPQQLDHHVVRGFVNKGNQHLLAV